MTSQRQTRFSYITSSYINITYVTLYIFIIHVNITYTTSYINITLYIFIITYISYTYTSTLHIYIQSKKGPTSCCSRDDWPLPSFAEINTVPHDNRWLIHAAPQLANLTCMAPTNLRASAPIK